MEFKKYANKIIIGSLGTLLAVAVAGDLVLIQKTNQLQADFQKNTEQIKALNIKVSTTGTETESWKKKYESAEALNKTDTDSLNEKIAAFAKQAASCDKIKKKLHLQ